MPCTGINKEIKSGLNLKTWILNRFHPFFSVKYTVFKSLTFSHLLYFALSVPLKLFIFSAKPFISNLQSSTKMRTRHTKRLRDESEDDQPIASLPFKPPKVPKKNLRRNRGELRTNRLWKLCLVTLHILMNPTLVLLLYVPLDHHECESNVDQGNRVTPPLSRQLPLRR